MWEVIAELAAAGVTVFLTTQYLEEADRLADRIAVIDGGRLVAEGTPAELKRRVAGQRLDLELGDADAFAARRGAARRRARRAPTPAALRSASRPTAAPRDVRALLDELDPTATRSRGSPCTTRRSTTSS